MRTIYLATNNHYKFEEIRSIAKSFSIVIKKYNCNIRELQTTDREQLIKHKTVMAFTMIRLPVLVDHASLEIECLNGMPGTLTQLFWDNLQGKICDIVSALGNHRARAITTVGFCDGCNLYNSEGVISGNISNKPQGKRHFQWDSIFIPDGEIRTYAQMEVVEKNLISQRNVAYKALFSKMVM